MPERTDKSKVQEHVAFMDRLEKKLNRFEYLVAALSMGFALSIVYFLWIHDREPLPVLVGSVTAMVSTLAALLIAERAANLSKIQRLDDYRRKTVMVSHHLIAVLSDMRGHVGYMRRMFTISTTPMFVFRKNVESIERSYAALMDREIYEVIPGEIASKIMNLSGSIFGISSLGLFIESIPFAQASRPNPSGETATEAHAAVERLSAELQELVDDVYALRSTID